jgi:hypothetical protein
VFQNVSSSGFQSEIQVGLCSLIENFLSKGASHRGSAQRHRGALWGGPSLAVSKFG